MLVAGFARWQPTNNMVAFTGLIGGCTREINEDIAAEIRATSGPNASRPHACDDPAQERRDRSFDAPDEQYRDDTDDAKSESGNESQASMGASPYYSHVIVILIMTSRQLHAMPVSAIAFAMAVDLCHLP